VQEPGQDQDRASEPSVSVDPFFININKPMPGYAGHFSFHRMIKKRALTGS